MAIVESLFDVSYLVIVIGLGIRLLLEKIKSARMFGVMSLLLGFGDAFHLLPRIISHLSPSGFAGHAAALSWGQFVTSITMTLFYVLYYYYYRELSDDGRKSKTVIVYGLAAIRIVLVVLPQNRWGQMPGDYTFGILRNIPFMVLGICLIIWSYRARRKAGLEQMWWLILLSFLFYIPVVLWSRKIPAIGALMMPKTVAYLLIVVFGFHHFIRRFNTRSILGISMTNLIMGLLAGVFYREFTKYYQFTDVTHLSAVHVHALVLGFILPVLMYIFAKQISGDIDRRLRKSVYLFEAGLILTLVTMIVIGIYEITSLGQDIISRAAIDGISGIGHIILAVGIVWAMGELYHSTHRVDIFMTGNANRLSC